MLGLLTLLDVLNTNIRAATFGNLPYQVNLVRGVEYLIPNMPVEIENCSTDVLYCYKTPYTTYSVFNVITPTRCSDLRRSQSWSIGSLTTRKLRRRPKRAAGTWYLATDGRPDVVYEVAERRGIVAIWMGGYGRDLASEVADGLDPVRFTYIGGRRNEPAAFLGCI